MKTGPNIHERYLQNIAKVCRQGELAANGGSTSRADLNNAGRFLDHIEAVVRDWTKEKLDEIDLERA